MKLRPAIELHIGLWDEMEQTKLGGQVVSMRNSVIMSINAPVKFRLQESVDPYDPFAKGEALHEEDEN